MTSDLSNYAIAFLMTLVTGGGRCPGTGLSKASGDRLLSFGQHLFVATAELSHPGPSASLRSAPVSNPEILLFEAGRRDCRMAALVLCTSSTPKVRRLLLLSLAMNGVSYSAGYFIPWV